MTQKNGIVVISRHGDKYTGQHGFNVGDDIPEGAHDNAGKPAFPASPEDKHFIYITPESAKELKEKGTEVLGDTVIDNALFMVSDFVRTSQSALHFTSETNLTNGRVFDPRIKLGFAYDGSNMKHEKIQPGYSVEKTQFDEFIKNLYQDHFFRPTEPGLPFMGEWLYHFVESIGDGIVNLQKTQGKEQSLLAHFTHTPNIDGLVMIALDCLQVDPVHQVVEVDTSKYRGGVAMGEMYTGPIFDLQSENPSIQLNGVKGLDVGYKLSDLRRIQQQVYENIQ